MVILRAQFVSLSFFVVTCFLVTASSPAQQQNDAPNTKLELRWVESKFVEGLTEKEGFQSSCDPDDIVYPHQKPALLLTANSVKKAELKTHNFQGSGLGVRYSVTLHLTDKARKQLAKSAKGNKMRLLTIQVNDKCWGVYRYEKDANKTFVPEQARAQSFTPNVGMFSTHREAQRIVDAIKHSSNEVKQ